MKLARENGAAKNAMMEMAIAMLTLEPGLKVEPYETIAPPPPPSPTWNIRKPPTFKNIAEKKSYETFPLPPHGTLATGYPMINQGSKVSVQEL